MSKKNFDPLSLPQYPHFDGIDGGNRNGQTDDSFWGSYRSAGEISEAIFSESSGKKYDPPDPFRKNVSLKMPTLRRTRKDNASNIRS
jgi:hypothetical protein